MTTLIFQEADGTRHEVDTDVGSNIMQVALDNGIDAILAECGGTCSCATCHTYINEDWASKLAPASDLELEMIEGVLEPRPTSRLACQIEVTADMDGMVLELPAAQI